MREKDKKQGKRYIIEIDPAKNGQDRRRVLYIYVPLILVALGVGAMLYINSIAKLPAWLNRLAGIRDPYETDFNWIASPPEAREGDVYENIVPDEDLLDNGKDGYLECEATNDQYDGYTCDASDPVDICLMDILPREDIPEGKASVMYVKLFNRGAAAQNVLITLQFSDGALYEGKIKELPTCSSQAKFRWTPKGKGDMTATSVVNSNKAVEETSYDNNAKNVKLFVGSRVSAPTIDDPGSRDYVEWTEDTQGNIIGGGTGE